MTSHTTNTQQDTQGDAQDGAQAPAQAAVDELDPRREQHEMIARNADFAYYSIRAINHDTITRHPIPAPVVYEVLGSLKQLGYALDQALGQIAVGLAASLEAPGLYEVYEADGSDPHESVASARAALNIACGAAADAATAIEHAQSLLTWQGYRPVTRTTGTGAAAGGGR